MQNLTKFEGWLNQYLERCDDIKLERDLRLIRQQYKEATHNDIRRIVRYNKSANDETVLKEIKP